MKIRNILVIRFRRVGDSILAMALCHTLKRNFPDARIDFVLDKNIAPLYENHPDIDHMILFTPEEKHSFFHYLYRVWATVHATRYDVIIDMRSTVQTLWFSLFSLHTSYRIGRRKSYNLFLQNFREDVPADISMVEQDLLLLSPLRREKALTLYPEFRLYVSDEERLRYRQYMERQGIDFSRPVVVAAVATRIPGKVWDRERMKAVLLKIVGTYDAQVIFNYGGKAEEDYALSLWNDMGCPERMFTQIRAENLRELVQMVANCDFFFGNEGGPRHLSQALGVPSFAIYPPNISKTVWLPDDGSGRYQGISVDDLSVGSVTDDMTYAEKFAQITVDEVWSRLQPMLGQYLKK